MSTILLESDCYHLWGLALMLCHGDQACKLTIDSDDDLVEARNLDLLLSTLPYSTIASYAYQTPDAPVVAELVDVHAYMVRQGVISE